MFSSVYNIYNIIKNKNSVELEKFIMIKSSEKSKYNIGDEVYIWDNKTITVDDIAKECKTINYEILCTISNRVIRREI